MIEREIMVETGEALGITCEQAMAVCEWLANKDHTVDTVVDDVFSDSDEWSYVARSFDEDGLVIGQGPEKGNALDAILWMLGVPRV